MLEDINSSSEIIVANHFSSKLNLDNLSFSNLIINGGAKSNYIKLFKLLKNKSIHYIMDKYDFQNCFCNEQTMIDFVKIPNSIRVEFKRGTHLFIINGGLPSDYELSDMYFSNGHNFNNDFWHDRYKNKFGYIISSSSADSDIKFYNFSANINNSELCLQFADENGLGKTVLVN